MNFKSFSFHLAVAEGVRRAGYCSPTPIQAQAIPEIMNGHDVMGLAQTGTGKTAAFVLPILNRLIVGPQNRIRALIIAPTRELAEQTHTSIGRLGSDTGLRSTAVYGGVNINTQIRALVRTNIAVGCPGRLLDHIGRKTIDLSQLEVLVLDEADRMFDMGFFPDIRRILSHIPARNRQTLLFSATMPKEIRLLAEDILTDPKIIQMGISGPAETVNHALFPVAPHLKTALLKKLLRQSGTGSILVFTRTKHRAKSLGDKLAKAGYRSASLQGNLSQSRRQMAMDSFRSGKVQILVATDIAARGIDVSNVARVINYDIPDTPEAYIHRIGRTGRAKCQGEALTLVTEADHQMVSAIHKAVGERVEQRFLEDFDYNAWQMKADISARSTHKPSQVPRGRKFSKATDRTKEGAFAFMSPRKSAGPDRRSNRLG